MALSNVQVTADDGVTAFAGLRAFVFVAILSIALVSLTPFPDLGDPRLYEVTDGNETLAYFLFFGFAIIAVALVWRTDRTALKSLLVPSFVALAFWVGVTCVLSQDPASSMKRATMLVFVSASCASLFLLPRDREEVGRLLSLVAFIVITLSYLGLLFMPQYAIHQATDLAEPQLAGDWRGVFGHKNMASAIFSILSFVGLYVKSQRPLEGWVITLLSLVFVIASGGKSSSVLCLTAIFLSSVAVNISNFWIWSFVVFCPLVTLNLLGLGSVAIPQVGALLSSLPIDASFTGRTDVWAFAIPKTFETPIFGHGYLAFWNTSDMIYGGGEQSTDWAQTASHAHNGYLDAALSMGFPGLLMFLAALAWQPARDIHSSLSQGQEPELTLMFQRVWMFSLYLSSFETFVFNRAHPGWVLLLFAVFSLRYLSQFKVARAPRPAVNAS